MHLTIREMNLQFNAVFPLFCGPAADEISSLTTYLYQLFALYLIFRYVSEMGFDCGAKENLVS